MVPSIFPYTFLIVSLIRHAHSAHKILPEDAQRLNVVGLFSSSETEQQRTFLEAVEKINKDSSILHSTLLVPHVEIIELYDAFNVSKTVCQKIQEGVSVFIGPSTVESNEIVQSIANSYMIPHIYAMYVPYGSTVESTNSISFNMFPFLPVLSEGIAQLISDMDWVSFTILYEKDEDLVLFQELLKLHDGLKDEENYGPIVLRQLPEESDYRPLLKIVHKTIETRILISCVKEKVLDILDQAMELHLMGDYYNYVIASFDAHTLDYSDYVYTDTNITVFRLIDVDKYIERQPANYYNAYAIPEDSNTTAALIYDSVLLFGKALDKYLLHNRLQPVNLVCGDIETRWDQGAKLSEQISKTAVAGVSDVIRFNADTRHRTTFIIQLIQLTKVRRDQGIFKVLGTWSRERKIDYSRNETQISQDLADFMANKTFIVASRLGEPYLMNEDGWQEKFGNSRYKGFSMDVIEEVSKIVGFSYEFEIVKGNKHGKKDPETGKWDGIIKELQDRRADLGICDLTITEERKTAVDFTKPFMTLGISILYKEGVEEEGYLFSFLLPIDFKVWLCVGTALLGVSIVLFIVSRCTPNDWENPHPCDPNVEELENPLTLVNCLWFSLGSVLQQGCDILPKALSTRLIAALWWFFTLIMVSTYTANLAAFLTTQQMEADIKDVEQLASQSKIKYGCYSDGSTATYFKASNDNLYQKIWATMESAKPTVFTGNNQDGVDRVLKDKQGYAFFMESSSIEYEMERHCELTQIGGLLDNKGYGIAMPINSPYRTAVSSAVLYLQENGKLRQLKDRWWSVPEPQKCRKKSKEDKEDENAMEFSNVGGVFLVLFIGIGISFILSILEFLWNIRKVAVVERISLSRAFWSELKFVLQINVSTKPVKKPESENSEPINILERYRTFVALRSDQESHARSVIDSTID